MKVFPGTGIALLQLKKNSDQDLRDCLITTIVII